MAKFLTEADQAPDHRPRHGEPGDLAAHRRRRAGAHLQGAGPAAPRPRPAARSASGRFRFVWITEFPLFEGIDEEGHLIAAHHPFTMPHPDDIDLLETRSPRGALAELRPGPQRLGARIGQHPYPPGRHPAAGVHRARDHPRRRPRPASGSSSGRSATVRRPTGASPSAWTASWPLLAGEDNIREVIAYPKTQSGADLMSGAPPPHQRPRAGRARHPRASTRSGSGRPDHERGRDAEPTSRAGGNRPPDLFDLAAADELTTRAPLAARLRPTRSGRGRRPTPSARRRGAAAALWSRTTG